MSSSSSRLIPRLFRSSLALDSNILSLSFAVSILLVDGRNSNIGLLSIKISCNLVFSQRLVEAQTQPSVLCRWSFFFSGGDLNSIQELTSIMTHFNRVSGLSVNAKKVRSSSVVFPFLWNKLFLSVSLMKGFYQWNTYTLHSFPFLSRLAPSVAGGWCRWVWEDNGSFILGPTNCWIVGLSFFFLDPCKPFPVEVIRYHPVPARKTALSHKLAGSFI